MTAEQTNRPKSILSCILCSVAWVLVTCWLGAVHFVILLFSAYTIRAVGFILWAVACAILYWLLLWWTGRAYPSWGSLKFGIILQFCLVAISMVVAYFFDDGVIWLTRPVAFFTLPIFDMDNELIAFPLNYLIAFAEIVGWQALALPIRRILDKRKAKKQKNKPVQSPARREEW